MRDVIDFLPGIVEITRGSAADYEALARFHYVGRRPATWAGVWAARYEGRVAAVGVLSYPVPCRRGREIVFPQLRAMRYRARMDWANANVRTIARVIVHPQFRGVGLASVLVRRMCREAQRRYVEASARMGRAHPLFSAAGMRRVEAGQERPVYYIWDNGGGSDGTGEAVGDEGVRQCGGTACMDQRATGGERAAGGGVQASPGAL